jgi:hypothetical protein
VKTDRDTIALVLAIGLCTALNLLLFAVVYDALRDPSQAGISENATQVLTGWGGGIVGILGAVFGYRAGQNSTTAEPPTYAPPPDDDDAA